MRSSRFSQVKWTCPWNCSPIALALVVAANHCVAGMRFSECTNGVFVGVCGKSAVSFTSTSWISNGAPIRCEDHLDVSFFCRTGPVRLLVPTSPVYFVTFTMWGSSGKELQKTREGRKWGSEVKNFPLQPYRGNRNRFVMLSTAPWAPQDGSYSFGPSLPAPADLFVMGATGLYHMRLDFNVMTDIASTNGLWKPLRIPPVNIEIIK